MSNLLACQGEGTCFGEFQVFGIQDRLGTSNEVRDRSLLLLSDSNACAGDCANQSRSSHSCGSF